MLLTTHLPCHLILFTLLFTIICMHNFAQSHALTPRIGHCMAMEMAVLSHSNSKLSLIAISTSRLTSFKIFFFLLLVQVPFKLVNCRTAIEFLPGFEGPLPFQFETGYVGVGESEDVQLFYYFVKADINPEKAPIMIWIAGGPGCSSFSGLIFENGPVSFEIKKDNGSLPRLVSNPYSWTKVLSLLYMDYPVGTGYSYARTESAAQTTDVREVNHAYEFIRKWLMDHPELISNPVYLAGDSYAGITIPPIVQVVTDGNEAGVEPFINLKGYVLGNGRTFPGELEYYYIVPFAYCMALIPKELYESLLRSCGGDYSQNHKSISSECSVHLDAFHESVKDINTEHILEPYCGETWPNADKFYGKRRSLNGELEKLHAFPSIFPEFECRLEYFALSEHWMNDKNVRKALNVQEGLTWKRCNLTLPYAITIMDVRPYHAYLSTKSYYRSLIYSGDHDMKVTHFSTQDWIKALNYSIVDEWRPWYLNGQVAGYTRTYSNQMTFATVKGAGHVAPESKMEECAAMVKRWIADEPL